MKRILLAIVAVFVVWTGLDMLIHGVCLGNAYAETAELWRPEGEMKFGLMRIVTVIAASAFVLIYALLINPKSIKAGLLFGLLYGIATGVGMGYGTYAVIDLPYVIPFTWFNGTILEALCAGAVTAAIVK